MLGGEKGSVAFHGDHRPAKVATHRRSRNLYNSSEFPMESQKYISKTDGLLYMDNDGNWSATVSYMPCSELVGKKIYIPDFGSSEKSTGGFAFYDENMDYISGESSYYAVNGYVVPSGAAYMRISVRSVDTEEMWISVDSPMPYYEPYGTIEQVISEPAESTQEGTMLTFDRTYNDVAHVSVFGESTQETLTGKNLWCFSQSYSSEEGRYSNWTANNTPFSLNAGTYTVSATEKNLQDSAPLFGYLQDGTRIELIRFYANTKSDNLSNTFTISQPITSVWFVANQGGSVENIMIEAGSEATTYEPYCGGIPAPNPSYPMPIVSRASACVETSNADGTKTSTTDLTALLDGRELRSLPDGTRDEVQVRGNGDGTGDVVLVERVGEFTATNAELSSVFDEDGTASWISAKGVKWAIPGATLLSNRFVNRSDNVHNRMVPTDNTLFFRANQSVVGSTSESIKSWLAANETKVLYPLATPTETVLGTIPMPETFYDTTHIWEANGADISAKVKVIP